tara:strand:+ start:307476 stop:307778 length:303 start_codon:yes stop_codon:yes gene_type:complete
MFIISIKYVKSEEEIDALLTAHHRFLKEQYAAGVFLMSGRKVPRSGGIILADATDRADIEAIIQLDPFYEAGIAEYDITEFVPTMTAESLSAFQYIAERH